MDEWEKCLVTPDKSIRQAMEDMGRSRQQIILVVDAERRLLGSVTEGDFRRGILKGVTLDQPVSALMKADPVTTTPGSDVHDRIALMRRHSIRHIPVVDGAGRVVGLVRPEGIIEAEHPERDNWTVLMAGGQGRRLRPLTESTPKPLLEVGGRPIMETVIGHLIDHGFRRFYVAVNYKAEKVKECLGDGSRFGAEIRYIEETTPLGTAGALGLIRERPESPLLVVNADVLTKHNFSSFLSHHREMKGDATMCVRGYDVQIPFGVVRVNEFDVVDIVEKPIEQFMVNAGIYVIEPGVLDRIPKNVAIDMPDVLCGIVRDGGKVVAYPIQEYWVDIGRLEDFNRAIREFDENFD